MKIGVMALSGKSEAWSIKMAYRTPLVGTLPFLHFPDSNRRISAQYLAPGCVMLIETPILVEALQFSQAFNVSKVDPGTSCVCIKY